MLIRPSIMPILGPPNKRVGFAAVLRLVLIVFAMGLLTKPSEASEQQWADFATCEIDRVLTASEVPEMVNVLLEADPESKAFCEAEKLLGTGPPREVFEALLPTMSFGYQHRREAPPEFVYNDRGFRTRIAIDPWLRVYTARRVVDTVLAALSDEDAVSLSKDLLEVSQYTCLHRRLIDELHRSWDTRGELICRQILERYPADAISVAAAGALLIEDVWTYYGAVMEAAGRAIGDTRARLVEALLREARRNLMELDPDLIRMVTQELHRAYNGAPQQLSFARELARSAGGYTGLDFYVRVKNPNNPHGGESMAVSVDLALEELSNLVRDLEAGVFSDE